MKDFISEIDKSYPIPTSVAIMSGDEPIDIRQTCDTVEDFEKFKNETGMELRYAGLVTYEKSTKIFKGCTENEDGTFEWVNLNMEHKNEVEEMTKELDILQERMSSFMIEFEENVKMMNIEF